MCSVVLYTVLVLSFHEGRIHDPGYAMTLTEAQAFVENERTRYGAYYREHGFADFSQIVKRPCDNS